MPPDTHTPLRYACGSSGLRAAPPPPSRRPPPHPPADPPPPPKLPPPGKFWQIVPGGVASGPVVVAPPPPPPGVGPDVVCCAEGVAKRAVPGKGVGVGGAGGVEAPHASGRVVASPSQRRGGRGVSGAWSEGVRPEGCRHGKLRRINAVRRSVFTKHVSFWRVFRRACQQRDHSRWCCDSFRFAGWYLTGVRAVVSIDGSMCGVRSARTSP